MNYKRNYRAEAGNHHYES